MFTITSNRKINGLHWGLRFKAGVAHTDNAALANKLGRKGYVVTDEQPAAVAVKAEKTPAAEPAKPKPKPKVPPKPKAAKKGG